tara:strand:+ start:1577 stop:2053 length:477 start_codon:yes stop_codon:yes gene_type:complete
MNLGTILAIALPVLAGTIGGGGGAPTSKSYAGPEEYAKRKKSTGFLSSDFGKVLVDAGKAYVDSTTDAQGNRAPMFQAPTPRQNRSIAQLTRGNPARGVQMTTMSNPVFNMPQVQTAFTNLAQNAANSQVQRMLREYMVTPNLAGDRTNIKIKTTEIG